MAVHNQALLAALSREVGVVVVVLVLAPMAAAVFQGTLPFQGTLALAVASLLLAAAAAAAGASRHLVGLSIGSSNFGLGGMAATGNKTAHARKTAF